MVRRVAVGIVVAALAAGAAGLVAALRSEPAEATARPGLLAAGSFRSLAWPTKGRAEISRRADGQVVLRLRDFDTHVAPELFVYLVPLAGVAGDVERGWKIARLGRVTGDSSYVLPAKAGSVEHPTVVIWCALCAKPWGEAELTRVPRPAQSEAIPVTGGRRTRTG